MPRFIPWWESALYRNEFFLFVPLLTWTTVRKDFQSRVIDLLRTVPPFCYAIYISLGGHISGAVLLSIAAWTVVANLAMYRADKKNDYPYDRVGELVYAASFVSLPSFLFDCAAHGGTIRRVIVITANIIVVVYLAWNIAIAVVIADAWACYPTEHVSSFVLGYCPQYTGTYAGNRVCTSEQTGNLTQRCSQTHRPSAHELAPAAVHFLSNVILVGATVYAYDTFQAVQRQEFAVCRLRDAKEK